MFKSLARDAMDMASKNAIEHENHVAVCLDVARRTEGRFTGIEAKLDRQDAEAAKFREALRSQMEAIKTNDNKRYITMMRMAISTLVGILSTAVTIGVAIFFHFWK